MWDRRSGSGMLEARASALLESGGKTVVWKRWRARRDLESQRRAEALARVTSGRARLRDQRAKWGLQNAGIKGSPRAGMRLGLQTGQGCERDRLRQTELRAPDIGDVDLGAVDASAGPLKLDAIGSITNIIVATTTTFRPDLGGIYSSPHSP